MSGSRPTSRLGPLAALSVAFIAARSFGLRSGSDDTFSIEQVRSYAYPSDLVTASRSARIAWVENRKGRRNIWSADAPAYSPVQVTHFVADDGQELTQLGLTPDGSTIVYVRGGDHGANGPAEGGLAPDPQSNPQQPQTEIWTVPAKGDGAPRLLAKGDEPVVSPQGDRVVFTRDRALWVVPVAGSQPEKRLFFARGTSTSPVWSPDGSRLAFVSDRADHAFIAIFTDDTTPLLYVAPSSSRDMTPRWSPDGTRIAFVRTPGDGGPPQTLLDLHPQPWAIWTADARGGAGRKVWESPKSLEGSLPETDGGPNLNWAAGGRIVFLSDVDGWPHLYSIPEGGGETMLLTPGPFMAEFISISPDRRSVLFAANTGPESSDDDRRHIVQVLVDRPGVNVLTPGIGVEWQPSITGDQKTIAFIGAGVTTPPVVSLMPRQGGGGKPVSIGGGSIPSDYPSSKFVIPRKVVFKAPDGTLVHGQLFERPSGGKRPAVVFAHGGPPRQMLLGWHYMEYYSNAYAMNQYLANHGYVVLSVNYRLGIGYGHNFNHPEHWGPTGASEYQDVKAAGEYLRGLPGVDAERIGIWGGSYGGYLTALALARDSRLFRTGVDLHGVHDWTKDFTTFLGDPGARYEQADRKQAMDVAWQSSPVSAMDSWQSSVMLVHGDDDRNVSVHATIDLARRLDARGIRYEELIIPDEIHDFLRYATWLLVDSAVVRWLDAELRPGAGVRP